MSNREPAASEHRRRASAPERNERGGEHVRGAAEVVAGVVDPELPVLTLAELGVIRSVRTAGAAVTVTITPTYTGCPAMDAIRADLRRALLAAGYTEVTVRTELAPPWSTDWITAEGHRKLAAAGIAPPGAAPRRPAGPVPLTLEPPPARVSCPRCGSPATELTSQFGPTPCTALRRCLTCREPFQHVKEL